MIAVTVTVPSWDASATTSKNIPGTIAHATSVEFSNTWIDVVADAVGVRIGLTRPATLAEGVKLVSVAVAVSGRDAVTAADAALVEDVAVTVAVSFRDVGTSTLVDLAWSATNTTSVQVET